MFKWIKNLFSGAARAVRNFIEAAIPVFLKFLYAEIKDFAVDAVAELDGLDILNEEKRKVAFDRIREEADKRKLEIADSAINLLIELAVQYLKQAKK